MDRKAAGAVSGVITYLVGYFLTFGLKAGASRRWLTAAVESVPGEPSLVKVIGWIYYRMHGTTIAVSISGRRQSRTLSVDPTVGPNPVWDAWLLVIPPLLLMGAGYLLARDQDALTVSVGARTGAMVTIGYLPVVVLGALSTQWAFQTSQFGETVSVVAGPNIVQAVVVAGVVYPSVAGATGGFIYGASDGAGSGAPARTGRSRHPPAKRESTTGASKQRQRTGATGGRSNSGRRHGHGHGHDGGYRDENRHQPSDEPVDPRQPRAQQRPQGNGDGPERRPRAERRVAGRNPRAARGEGATRRARTRQTEHRQSESGGPAFDRADAGFGARAAAFVIDYLLTGVTVGLYWLYWLYRTAERGDSVGKSAMDIVVVTRDGSRSLGFGRAVVREVVGRTVDLLLFGVGLLWILVDDEEQAIHDKIARTYVVEEAAGDDAPGRQATGGRRERGRSGLADPSAEDGGTDARSSLKDALVASTPRAALRRLGWFSLLLSLVTGVFGVSLLYLSRVGYQRGAVYVQESYYFTTELTGSAVTVPLAYVYFGVTVVFVLLGVGALRRWSGIWVAAAGWYTLVLVAFLYPPSAVWAVLVTVPGVYWAIRGRTAATVGVFAAADK